MTLRPCLIVGVGGSGGKTLRFLRAQLLRQLRAHGVDELPEAWQMLYVDVPTDQEGGGEEAQDGLPPKLPDRDYLGLVNEADIRYSTVDQAVVNGAHVDSFVGWRPSPQDVSVPIYKGAGQYRTVGRMISVYALSQLAETVRGAVARLTTGEVHSELAEVSRKLGFETPTLTGPADTWVFVVTSLAGGTGSGVFLDVCDVIRATADGSTWADESLGIIYTGEVFGELRVTTTTGFGTLWLAPRLPKLYELYPDIKIDLMLEERVLDLPMREADVAIRMKEPSQADLIRKRLMSVRMRLYATQDYLKGRKPLDRVEHIADHRLICQQLSSTQVSAGATLIHHLMSNNVQSIFTVNNYFGVLQGVINNLGVGVLPDYVVEDFPDLVRCLPEIESGEVPVFLAYPEELRQSKRIMAFRDFVQDEIFAHRRTMRDLHETKQAGTAS